MHWMQYILPVLLSVFTGWFVTWITGKLLFHPAKPINIAGFKFQGIIPRNQKAIAEKLATLLSAEFLSLTDLQKKIKDPDNYNKLKPEIEKHIDIFLREKLKDTFPMLSMLIGDKTINQLKAAFMTELESLFPLLMKSYFTKLEQEIDIEKLVRDKIADLSASKAEQIIKDSGANIFLYIQLLGVFIGLITGLLHVLLNTQLY